MTQHSLTGAQNSSQVSAAIVYSAIHVLNCSRGFFLNFPREHSVVSAQIRFPQYKFTNPDFGMNIFNDTLFVLYDKGR